MSSLATLSTIDTAAVDEYIANNTLLHVQIMGTDRSDYVINVNALLDSGAKQDNYISREVAEELKSNGALVSVCACPSTVCSAFSGLACVECNDCITINVKFYNEIKRSHEIICITCRIIVTNEDLIIGRPTMMKESITQKCASQFQLPNTCLPDKADCTPVVERSHDRSKGTGGSRVQTLAMLRCVEE
jgi:hypothetical protein